MKNRKWLLIVSLVLALTMSLGGTLAYLTDTDEAVNVMTLGNVKIEQTEIGADGDIFKQGQPLYPVYDNGTEKVGTIVKKVSVENTGTADAYIRTWMAFEAGNITDRESFESLIKITFAVDPAEKVNWLPDVYEIDGQKYFIANVLYSNAVKPGDTVKSLDSFYMVSSAGNDDVAQFGNTYEVLVLSQGVQTNNMPGAAEAMDAAFPGMVHPWEGKDIAELPTKVVKTAADLKTALEEGGMTVVLGADIDMGTEMVTIPAGVNARLDLAGHNLKTDLSGKGDVHTALFTVKQGASLTINGNGNVHAVANQELDKVSAIINNDAGNVTINGGNYTMDYGTYDEGYLIPTIVDNNSNLGNATLTINGGTFTHHRNMFRNFANAQGHNNYATVAKIVINGGTFIADGEGEAFIWNQKLSEVEGAGVVEINGGTFAGVKVNDGFTNTKYDPVGENVKTVVPVNTADQLKNTLDNGKDVLLTDDVTAPLSEAAIYGTPVAVIQKNGGVIDGNGHSLDIENPQYEGYAIETWGGTIRNLTIDTAVGRGIIISAPKADVYIDNVVVDGPGYAINTTEHNGKKLFVSNSTVKGWTSLAGLESATFTKCTFGENTSKYWQNYGYGQDYDRLIRPYVTAEFNTCVFEQGYYIDLSVLEANCKVTLNGCTTNGTKITADNYEGYITIELPAGRTLDDCVIFK